MPSKTAVKRKKSFTLSHSSLAFLEKLRRERRVSSTSRVLDEMILREQARHRRKSVEEAIADYYSQLPKSERAEQRAWAEFAQEQLGEEMD